MRELVTTVGSMLCARRAGGAAVTCVGRTSRTKVSCVASSTFARAEAIGELDEAKRCELFLQQLDNTWAGLPT